VIVGYFPVTDKSAAVEELEANDAIPAKTAL